MHAAHSEDLVATIEAAAQSVKAAMSAGEQGANICTVFLF